MKLPSYLKSILNAPRILLGLVIPLSLFLVGWWFGLPPDKESKDTDTLEISELWTCSMHPQIRQPNFGLCPICNMDLILLKNDGGGGGLRELTVSPEAAALLDLRVSPVRRAPAMAELKLFGRIDYDERRVTAVSARMGGRLDRLFVDFTGALVRKGDHLAEIYSPELFVAQKELIGARRAYDQNSGTSSAAVRETRRRLLDSAREKLRLWQLTAEQIAAIELQDKPDPTVFIDSPQDGVVVEKMVSEGSYVKTGEPLLRVAELDSVWLKVEAYESDLPWIRYAQDVEFTVDSIPGRNFHGRVAFIDSELNNMRRIASVRVNVPNPEKLLKPGAFAKVHIKSRMTDDARVIDPDLAGKWISPMHPEILKDGPGKCDICAMDLVPVEELGYTGDSKSAVNPLLIPHSAVLRTGDRAVVYLRLPEEPTPVFEGREIVIGPRVGHDFIVRQGLEEGELVVTRGAFKLDSELQIKGKPSMMNPVAGIEERSANTAPEALAGQWPPILRALYRLQKFARTYGAAAGMTAELEAMQSLVRKINTESLQTKDLQLWKEFSNRLLGEITLATDRVETQPLSAANMVTRAITETGRYLGLPWEPIEAGEIDPKLVESLRLVIAAYLPLGKALADDDDSTAAKAAATLHQTVQPLDLPDSDLLLATVTALDTAPDIDARRAAFRDLSVKLIELVRAHGIDQLGDLYVVHCPMAFEAGADWLSAEPSVLNPYYGDEMLTCGDVTDTLSVVRGPAPKPPESGQTKGNHEDHKH